MINDYRLANGAGPLTRQNQLEAAAQVHAEDMATHDYVGYTLSNGQSWGQNIAASGYDGAEPWGVLLGAGFDTAAAAFQGWRNDPIRDAVMLQPLYEEIGIRRVASSTATYDWYWVTTLGAG